MLLGQKGYGYVIYKRATNENSRSDSFFSWPLIYGLDSWEMIYDKWI